MYRGKPQEWRIVDLNYTWQGFEFIKLKSGKDYIFVKHEQCFEKKQDCKEVDHMN